MRFTFDSRMRGLLLAGVFALASPAAAGAATVSESGGTLTYSTAPGESNHVVISALGFALKVTETGMSGSTPITLVSGPGCWQLADGSATCSAAASALSADLGHGDDFFDASIVTAAASLTGGSGEDILKGGPGNDNFYVSDGALDTVSCGGGTDAGDADLLDSFDPDCESVLRPEAPVAPEPKPPAQDPTAPEPDRGSPDDPGDTATATPAATATPSRVAPANAAAPTIPAQTVRISASGVARVQVVCPADSGGCAGTVAIELPTSSKGRLVASARKRRSSRIGRARFTAKAGTAPIVPVRLSKRGRQRIVRGRRSRGRIRVTTRSADGRRVVTTREVAFSPFAKRSRGRR